MTYSKITLAALAMLLVAALAGPTLAAVACSATGVTEPFGDDEFYFYVTVNWDFNEAARPAGFNLSLEHLDGCSHYDPENPNQEDYILLRRGFSLVDTTCYAENGALEPRIHWEPYLEFEDEECWMPSRHLAWRNDGLTQNCIPTTAGEATLRFVSSGAPIGAAMYYDLIVIKADDGTCVVCDYFGPLPDCNEWSPVEGSSWSTIKALYK